MVQKRGEKIPEGGSLAPAPTSRAYKLINQILKYIELIGTNSYIKSQSVDII